MKNKDSIKITVAQLGTRRHYAVPSLFHNAGILEHFYTDAYIGDKIWLKYLVRLLTKLPHPKALERFLGRAEAELPKEKTTSFDIFGIQYAWKLWRAKTKTDRTSVHLWVGKKFCEKVIYSGLKGANAICAFNSAAREVFQFAKEKGRKCILEQVAAPISTLNQFEIEEWSRWQGWQSKAWQDDYLISTFAEREKQEWKLADLIICGSEFVKNHLLKSGINNDKIKVVPYGIDINKFYPRQIEKALDNKLNLLFAGRVSLLKGTPYLLNALNILKSPYVNARLIGSIAIRQEKLKEYSRWSKIIGAVPRSKIFQHYQWADIFVFPTICDGFGLVQVEALNFGLPVITTPNCGSVVRDGVEGFIVPIRDAEALADRIDRLAKDRELLRWMSHNARKRAKEFGWKEYTRQLVESVKRSL